MILVMYGLDSRPLFSRIRLHLSVGVLSVAVITFQLVLMQLLSIGQWHHFAYMVISVALLGFGAAGTVLALGQGWLLNRFGLLLPLLMLGAGAAMAGVVALSKTFVAPFDSYLLFVDTAQVGVLLLTYLLFFIPFFLSALALGMVFVRQVEQIGSYYFVNLFGSGVGGLLALALFWAVEPERLPGLTALIPVIAGLLILPRRFRGSLLLVASLAAGLALLFLYRPPELPRSPYKSLSYTLNLPGAEIVLERISPYGLVQVVSAPALRHAPGLSLTYTQELPPQQAVFNNGNWFGSVTAWTREDTTHWLDYTTAVLPYVLQPRRAVLILNAGTGEDVAHALTREAQRAVAVEPHEVVARLMKGALAGSTDSLLHHTAVSVHTLESRAYLAADTARYDLIVLPPVGAFGGTIGLTALQEQYLLTREGLHEIWSHLKPDGAIGITVWMDYPFRHALRLLATLVEVLEEEGIEDPGAYLAAVRSWGAVTFVLKRTPLSVEEREDVRQFCERLSFDPLLLPDLRTDERARYNRIQDERFFAYVDTLLSPNRTALYRTYDFALRPATDDRPYFSQFMRWRRLPRLTDLFGNQTVPFLEVGTLIVGVTLIQVFLLAVLLIIMPLFRLGWRGPRKGWTLAYFGSLGMGYMFVEMVLIQRFTLYLGHPIYATTAVLATLLVCSGVGSFLSERLAARRVVLRRVAGAAALFLLLYALVLTPLLQAGMAVSGSLKALLTFLLLAPPACLMGMPFPLGLRYLSEYGQQQVPWAWGINGCLSVIGAALAPLLAVEIGFVMVMGLAAATYGFVALLPTGQSAIPSTVR